MTDAPLPFLPGTHVQYADVAVDLIQRAAFVNGCLECHLAPNVKGYCYISLGGRAGIKIRAHRLIWIAEHGPIPDDLFVLHSCDNRRCILGDHLFLGTAKDNTKDMMDKGRGKYGIRKPMVDLDVIIALHHDGYSRFEIASMLRVSPSTIWNYTSPRGPYHGR